MFKLGATLTTRRDWYLAIDGDEIVTDVPEGLRDTLRSTDLNAGFVDLWNSAQGYTVDQPIRQFFRALRGLTVTGNHWTYRAGDHHLWGDPREGLEPAFDSGVRIEHRWQARDAARLDARSGYYAIREELGVEGLAG